MLTTLYSASCIIDEPQNALNTTIGDKAARLDILRLATAWVGEER